MMGIPGLTMFPIGCVTEALNAEQAVFGIIRLQIWEGSKDEETLPG